MVVFALMQNVRDEIGVLLLPVFIESFRLIDEPVDNGTVFNPGFPVSPLVLETSNCSYLCCQASCPFVTAVGATQVNPGSTVNDPEGACEQVIFSGGGFSNIFP